MENYCLCNKMEVPVVGFGTYNAKGGDNLLMIKSAIEAGYRYFDTASLYGTERALGQAVKESGVPRQQFIIASKVWIDEMGYENTKQALNRSLERLQTDYLDFYLIHWPKESETADCWKELLTETWSAMEELVEEGKVKALGLSNFLPHHMDIILKNCKIKPVVNQLEVHPGYSQEMACAYSKEKGILVQAWSPLARGAVQGNVLLEQLAAKYEKTVAQICMRFLYQKGIMPIVKSAGIERMKENMDFFDFEMDGEDIQLLSCMPQDMWSGEHPDTAIPKAKSNPEQ